MLNAASQAGEGRNHVDLARSVFLLKVMKKLPQHRHVLDDMLDLYEAKVLDSVRVVY